MGAYTYFRDAWGRGARLTPTEGESASVPISTGEPALGRYPLINHASLMFFLSVFSVRRISVHTSLAALYRRTMSTRTYRDAVDHLNSLQSNAATLEAVRASGGRLSDFAIPEMIEYLQRIGYSASLVSLSWSLAAM